jgi:hypothetical protein
MDAQTRISCGLACCHYICPHFEEDPFKEHRQHATVGRRLPGGHRVIGYSFFTAGETPAGAIAQLRPRWSQLRFVLQPRPLD